MTKTPNDAKTGPGAKAPRPFILVFCLGFMCSCSKPNPIPDWKTYNYNEYKISLESPFELKTDADFVNKLRVKNPKTSALVAKTIDVTVNSIEKDLYFRVLLSCFRFTKRAQPIDFYKKDIEKIAIENDNAFNNEDEKYGRSKTTVGTIVCGGIQAVLEDNKFKVDTMRFRHKTVYLHKEYFTWMISIDYLENGMGAEKLAERVLRSVKIHNW